MVSEKYMNWIIKTNCYGWGRDVGGSIWWFPLSLRGSNRIPYFDILWTHQRIDPVNKMHLVGCSLRWSVSNIENIRRIAFSNYRNGFAWRNTSSNQHRIYLCSAGGVDSECWLLKTWNPPSKGSTFRVGHRCLVPVLFSYRFRGLVKFAIILVDLLLPINYRVREKLRSVVQEALRSVKKLFSERSMYVETWKLWRSNRLWEPLVI